MTHVHDRKLAALAAAPVGRGRNDETLLALGRLADLAMVPSGTVLQREGSWAPWTYHLLGGAAVLSVDGAPVGVAGAGAWLLGAGRASDVPLTVVTAADTPALCFRRAELDAARRQIPGLLPELAAG